MPSVVGCAASLGGLLTALFLALAPACAACRGLRFEPEHQQARLDPGSASYTVRARVTWEGCSEFHGEPELRFRVELWNEGFEPLALAPASYDLRDAHARAFVPGRVIGSQDPVPAGRAAAFQLAFAAPAGTTLEDLDLSALSLALHLADDRLVFVAPFQRARDERWSDSEEGSTVRLGARWYGRSP